MAYSKLGLVAVSLAALVVAGCQSSRLSSMNTQPAPLQAAPVGHRYRRRAAAPGRARHCRSIAVPRRARRHDRYGGAAC